jgi:WD40 repeat protein
MFWVDKKRQPIPLGAFPQERSDQLIPRLLATGKAAPSRTGRLRRLRRAEDDEVLVSFPRTDVVTSLAFVDRSALLASSSRNGTVRLWDIRSGQVVDQIPIGPPAHRVTITPSADGELLLCASNDGAVRMVHVGTGRVLHSARILEERPSGQRYILSEQVAVAPDGRIVVRPHDRDRVIALDLRTGQVLYEFESEDTPGSIAFDRRGHRLAVGGATSRQRLVIGGNSTVRITSPSEQMMIGFATESAKGGRSLPTLRVKRSMKT